MTASHDLVTNASDSIYAPPHNINLNELISAVLLPYQKRGRNHDLAVRCDSLPLTFGDPAALEHVLSELVRLILKHPVSGRKFLHIFCEEDKSVSNQPDRFILQFHANLIIDEQWKQLHMESILALQAILEKTNSRLIVHEIFTTGCVFSISLPGKLK